MTEFKLHPRTGGACKLAPEERGPMMTADAVARVVWEGKVSAKWVIQRVAGAIGFKIGKAWFFYQREAEIWKDEWIGQQRGEAQ